MGKRSVERRLVAAESRRGGAASSGPVSYHPEAAEYRDVEGNAVDPDDRDRLIVIPTDEQIERALETGNIPVGPV